MKKTALLILMISFFLFQNLISQNIAITDNDGYTPDASAMLDVNSTDKGLLVPRLTSAEREAVASPATGLLVFDTNENAFFYYAGSEGWLNLSAQIVSPTTAGADSLLFSVINLAGDTVFAVYPEGVYIQVGEKTAKGAKGGFAVGGLSSASKKVYTDNFLEISPGTVKIRIDTITSGKGAKGGFAVGGLSSAGKADPPPVYDFMQISPGDVQFYVDTADSKKGAKGGFAVGGLSSASKVSNIEYFKVSGDNSADTIDPSEPRLLWYPEKEAFLVGRVLVESVDNVGTNSFATGYEPRASGDFSQAMGYKAIASGDYSTAIGDSAVANADNAYAIGNNAEASDTGSYAFGTNATAIGKRSFALGSSGIDIYGFDVGPTKAAGDYSYAFGMGSVTTDTAQGAFAIGTQDTASGQYAFAIGYQAKASGQQSFSIGYRSLASGDMSVAIGDGSTASGQNSTAIGGGCIASDYTAFAAGNWNTASGSAAVALGSNVTASGHNGSAAIGYLSEASGSSSVALGSTNIASGDQSIAIGGNTEAIGQGSIALGSYIITSGNRAFGIGLDYQSTKWDITQANTMAIMGGNVGIGTVAPDKLLHVAGDARIEGDIYYNTGTDKYTKGDFVFQKEYAKDYEILEIEEFVQKNKHLPWVTSAKNEEDGINLTRMSFETLEAVENTQLQIIELKKENIELQAENEKLKDRILAIEKYISKQKQKLN